jgi:hypothetical protein
VDVSSLLHNALVSDSYDTLLVLDLLQSLFLHDLLLCFPDYLYAMFYSKFLDYSTVLGYCTVVELHTIVKDYTVISLEIVAHYIVVVLQTIGQDCIVDAA